MIEAPAMLVFSKTIAQASSLADWIRPARYASWVLCGLVLACGGPGEAQDPRDILGEELMEPEPDQPAEKPDPLDRNATEQECRAANERIHQIGTEQAVRAEADLEKQRAMRAGAQSAETKQALERSVKRCLAEGVSAREARCYASLPIELSEEQQEAAFQRCSEYQ